MYDTYWYNNLIKPELSPPNYIFGPVWAILYSLMFISLLNYAYTKGKDKTRGYIFFILQLALNILWSPVFFLMHSILLGLAVVILLDISILLTIKYFYKTSKISAYLLIPYLIWCLFATYLNFGYLILN